MSGRSNQIDAWSRMKRAVMGYRPWLPPYVAIIKTSLWVIGLWERSLMVHMLDVCMAVLMASSIEGLYPPETSTKTCWNDVISYHYDAMERLFLHIVKKPVYLSGTCLLKTFIRRKIKIVKMTFIVIATLVDIVTKVYHRVRRLP